jgi:hypothetical protein
MDDNTLSVILSRFDRLDNKIDNAMKANAELTSRVTAVETQIVPVIQEQTFRRRAQYLGHVISVAISTSIAVLLNRGR